VIQWRFLQIRINAVTWLIYSRKIFKMYLKIQTLWLWYWWLSVFVSVSLKTLSTLKRWCCLIVKLRRTYKKSFSKVWECFTTSMKPSIAKMSSTVVTKTSAKEVKAWQIVSRQTKFKSSKAKLFSKRMRSRG